jgi:hypothetical protein
MSRNSQRIASPVEAAPDAAYQPKTALGRRLWDLRHQILAEGDRPLGWHDLEREIAERRGERNAGD